MCVAYVTTRLTAHICKTNTVARFGPLKILAIPRTKDNFRAVDFQIFKELPEEISRSGVPKMFSTMEAKTKCTPERRGCFQSDSNY
jgi:hypothetical protein